MTTRTTLAPGWADLIPALAQRLGWGSPQVFSYQQRGTLHEDYTKVERAMLREDLGLLILGLLQVGGLSLPQIAALLGWPERPDQYKGLFIFASQISMELHKAQRWGQQGTPLPQGLADLDQRWRTLIVPAIESVAA